LPFNLRPTTRECVHLVTHDHFRSRDEDGGHTIRSTTAENHMLHTKCKPNGSMFYKAELWAIEVLHRGNEYFRPLLLLRPWHWPDDLHIRTWHAYPISRNIPWR